jgi:ribosome assembly protein RRB1
MSKRQADQADIREQNKSTAFGNGSNRHSTEAKNEMGDFEDAWEDEMEEEHVVENNDMEDEGEDGTVASFHNHMDGILILFALIRYGC